MTPEQFQAIVDMGDFQVELTVMCFVFTWIMLFIGWCARKP